MASDDEVKVVGAWPSPFVIRVKIALNIKRVKYQNLEETLGSKSDLLLKSNPVYKKIPVLIHGERPICESLVIVHYIDEVWASGPAVLPSDPYHRATARFWSTYIDETWFPSVKSILSGTAGDDAKQAAALEEANRGATLLEDAFTQISKGQKFFGGDKIGYLDIALGCFLGWIQVLQKRANVTLFDQSKSPNLSKWVHDFLGDEAVKGVVPESDKLMEFSKLLAAKAKDPQSAWAKK